MASYSDHTEWVEAYLDGTLTPEEKAEFESRLKADLGLQDELDLQRQALYGLRAGENAREKARLKEMFTEVKAGSQELKKKQPESRRLWPKYALPLAAGLILLLALAWLLGPRNSGPATMPQLADAYFAPYEYQVMRGDGDELDSLFRQAATAYRNGDYQTSFELHNELHRLLPNNDLVRLYQAISYYKTGAEAGAAVLLVDLMEKNGQYDEHARWYLLMCYLKRDQKESAMRLLEEIEASPRHFNREEALEIKKALEKE